MDWSDILEAEIDWKEHAYPEIDVRERYGRLVSRLNSNEIRSRVIFSTDHFSAYCFVLDDIDPRKLYANLGFHSTDEADPERVRILLRWLVELGKSLSRIVIFDQPFNSPLDFEKACSDFGIQKMERTEMRFNDTSTDLSVPTAHSDISIIPLEENRLREYAAAEFSAFTEVADRIFLPETPESLYLSLVNLYNLSSAQTVVRGGSLIALHEKSIVGGIITTVTARTVMISELFGSHMEQGLGISRLLLSSSIGALPSDMRNVVLWSRPGSKAYEIYSTFGFEPTGRREISYFTESVGRPEQVKKEQ